MKRVFSVIISLVCLSLVLVNCKKKSIPTHSKYQDIVTNVIKTSKNYIGTPYKFGGIDSKGMDCSGLIYTSFKEYGIILPRNSFEQSKKYTEIQKKDIRKGDLLYFNTSGSKINHTGIVCEIDDKKIVYFVHSSTSKGVRIDNLENPYWKPRFVKATRPEYSLVSKK